MIALYARFCRISAINARKKQNYSLKFLTDRKIFLKISFDLFF